MADAPKAAPQSQNAALTVVKQLKELWDKQPKGRRTLAVMTVLGVAGFVGITTVLHKTETWVPLAEGLSPSDSQNIYTTLMTRGKNARFVEGRVEVQESDLAEARAIATVTLPGVGHSSMAEQFDGQHLGRSSFDEQVAYKRALQGELARSIIEVDQLQSAQVQIAFGKKSAIKDMESPTTASVSVIMRPGQAKLTGEQVNGIRQTIANAVENLDASKVVVIGPSGPMDGSEKSSSGKQNEIEAQLADKVRHQLEVMVGAGHVSVEVNADLDTRKVSSTSDVYDPNPNTIRSESRVIDGNDPSGKPQSSIGGVAGAQGNLPGAAAPSAGAGAAAGSAAGNGHIQETKNYEINHKIENVQMPEQTVKKLHVAVLVDQGKDKDGKAVARKKEELDQMIAQAKVAAGLDDARGDQLELTSIAFAPVEVPKEPELPKSLLPVPMPVAIGGGVGALVLIVVAVLLLKGRGKKKNKTQALVLSGGKLAFPTPVKDFERVLDGEPVGATSLAHKETAGLPAGPTAKTAQERVMDVVRSDVDRAAGVLTAWLAETPPAQAAAKGASK